MLAADVIRPQTAEITSQSTGAERLSSERQYALISKDLIKETWQKELLDRINLCDIGRYSSAVFLHASGGATQYPRMASVAIPIHLVEPGNESALLRFLKEVTERGKFNFDILKPSKFQRILSDSRQWGTGIRPRGHEYTLTPEEEKIISGYYDALNKCPEICRELIKDKDLILLSPYEGCGIPDIDEFTGDVNGYYGHGKLRCVAVGKWQPDVIDGLILEELWHAMDFHYEISNSQIIASQEEINNLRKIYETFPRDNISDSDARDLNYLHVPAYFQEKAIYSKLDLRDLQTEFFAKSAMVLTLRARELSESLVEGFDSIKKSQLFSQSDYLMKVADYLIGLRADYEAEK